MTCEECMRLTNDVHPLDCTNIKMATVLAHLLDCSACFDRCMAVKKDGPPAMGEMIADKINLMLEDEEARKILKIS